MKTVTTANIITMIRGLIKDLLQTNGRDSYRYDADATFLLSKDFVSSSTIKVYKNGTLLTLTTHYTYNSTTNKITISTTLVKNDDIIVTYSYYDKYSDSELLSFISANLCQFVVHKYPKYFYVNDSSEIVTYDGVNPTVEEGNVIALITAIDIDPKNINIKTRDFSISSEESKSKSEQVSDIFSKWTRTFGDVSFLDED